MTSLWEIFKEHGVGVIPTRSGSWKHVRLSEASKDMNL